MQVLWFGNSSNDFFFQLDVSRSLIFVPSLTFIFHFQQFQPTLSSYTFSTFPSFFPFFEFKIMTIIIPMKVKNRGKPSRVAGV